MIKQKQNYFWQNWCQKRTSHALKIRKRRKRRSRCIKGSSRYKQASTVRLLSCTVMSTYWMYNIYALSAHVITCTFSNTCTIAQVIVCTRWAPPPHAFTRKSPTLGKIRLCPLLPRWGNELLGCRSATPPHERLCKSIQFLDTGNVWNGLHWCYSGSEHQPYPIFQTRALLWRICIWMNRLRVFRSSHSLRFSSRRNPCKSTEIPDTGTSRSDRFPDIWVFRGQGRALPRSLLPILRWLRDNSCPPLAVHPLDQPHNRR